MVPSFDSFNKVQNNIIGGDLRRLMFTLQCISKWHPVYDTSLVIDRRKEHPTHIHQPRPHPHPPKKTQTNKKQKKQQKTKQTTSNFILQPPLWLLVA